MLVLLNLLKTHGIKALLTYHVETDNVESNLQTDRITRKRLPGLLKFYTAVRKMSDIPFDVDRAARLELEWWIIHRQRTQYQPGDLAKALAELQAEIYRVPIDRLMEHGRLRAEAMTIRDTKAEDGGVTEEDWTRINELLRESWCSLAQAVKS